MNMKQKNEENKAAASHPHGHPYAKPHTHCDFQSELRELTPLDPAFPERLRNIPACPKCIYVRGELPPDDMPTVAIIGARDGSDYGKDVARSFGRLLAERGVGIVSGMAYGIDAAGQWGAVDAGGKTYAVLGNGLDICYPPSNFHLCEAILHSGGLLTELPLGSPPLPQHFASRNRLISGLSDAVLVIEAKERSGTSITVNFALEQGKQVFALPGRITDRLSQGCNRLIREGAEILTSVEDVLGCLHLKAGGEAIHAKRDDKGLSPLQKKLYAALPLDAIHIDQLLARCPMPVQELSALLLELEILGFTESPRPGYYRRKLG